MARTRPKRSQFRRRARAPTSPRLATVFECLACHLHSVRCTINRDTQIGQLSCERCGITFACPINHLSHAVDVYHEWIDTYGHLDTTSTSASTSSAH
ncbi:transcription elongation factor Elf1 like-domain-containing protein [Lobosporangium transversale]|uniref:Transcription elongation factor 1 homolog n=1 Tax=Lobosporangium transversale TaxID=64571 RepID=A0A1Y2GUG9_9FUNG|nr:transcription elongation factor Elf1 like-domain-containing protein [Lobosporangium transversale]ORZ23880.1 transcription elongation factor Elf1 like-domain-containing protein [Lobosporangium transversale]|eukprot:XP_021883694.1 transcription elongation factor Elf1 like-domain-containing protein [Lobosporangium transversale]